MGIRSNSTKNIQNNAFVERLRQGAKVTQAQLALRLTIKQKEQKDLLKLKQHPYFKRGATALENRPDTPQGQAEAEAQQRDGPTGTASAVKGKADDAAHGLTRGMSNLPEYIRKQNEQERELKLANMKSSKYDAVEEHLNPELREKNRPWIYKLQAVDSVLKQKHVKKALKKLKQTDLYRELQGIKENVLDPGGVPIFDNEGNVKGKTEPLVELVHNAKIKLLISATIKKALNEFFLDVRDLKRLWMAFIKMD